nr:ribonuclease H-like domain-containing protein [Tanacetum cinerariifolium]
NAEKTNVITAKKIRALKCGFWVNFFNHMGEVISCGRRKLIQKLLIDQKCMGYLVHSCNIISPTRYYKDDPRWSTDLKSKTTKDIISIGSFVEVLVLNQYVLSKKIILKHYFQFQDYALWDVIKNGNSLKPVAQTTTNDVGTLTTHIPGLVTTKEKAQKKNDVKARSMLLMALPNEHIMTFNQYKDAKSLFATIETRFSGNEATKKTQKTLLKQMYENFSATSTESLDFTFNRLQKIKTRKKITINGSDTTGFDKSKVECYNCHKMGYFARECKGPRNQDSRNSKKGLGYESYHVVLPPSTRLFSPPKLDLSTSGLEEFQQPKIKGYGPKTMVEKQTDVHAIAKVEFVRPKQEEKLNMTGNISYVFDFMEFKEGYVTFAGGANGGRITGKLTTAIDVNAVEDMGKYSEIPIDSHHTPTVTQPSTSSQPQQKQKSKKFKKMITEGEKLEKKASKKTHKLKRLYKIGSSTRVESSEDACLGDQEDASKQGRMIEDLDADEGVALVDETQWRNDQDMFDTSIFNVEEVVAKKEVSTADLVPTASKVVTTIGVKVSTATITSQISMDEITLAKALIDIKASKPKAKGIVIQEPSGTPTPTPIYASQQSSKAKDKGKAKMIELEKPLKRKDHIMINEEVARNLEAQMQAKLEEEERLARQKEEETNIALIEAFVPMDTKLVKGSKKAAEGSDKAEKGSSKRAADKLEQEDAKRQKIEEENESVELKRCLEIILEDDDDVTIEATPLYSKSPTIIYYKIYKEGMKRFFKIIRVDAAGRVYADRDEIKDLSEKR